MASLPSSECQAGHVAVAAHPIERRLRSETEQEAYPRQPNSLNVRLVEPRVKAKWPATLVMAGMGRSLSMQSHRDLASHPTRIPRAGPTEPVLPNPNLASSAWGTPSVNTKGHQCHRSPKASGQGSEAAETQTSSNRRDPRTMFVAITIRRYPSEPIGSHEIRPLTPSTRLWSPNPDPCLHLGSDLRLRRTAAPPPPRL
jgi:hypothetical protein